MWPGSCRPGSRSCRRASRHRGRSMPASLPVSSDTRPASTPAYAGSCAGAHGVPAGSLPGICRPPCRFARAHIRAPTPARPHLHCWYLELLGAHPPSPHTSSHPLLSKLSDLNPFFLLFNPIQTVFPIASPSWRSSPLLVEPTG